MTSLEKVRARLQRLQQAKSEEDDDEADEAMVVSEEESTQLTSSLDLTDHRSWLQKIQEKGNQAEDWLECVDFMLSSAKFTSSSTRNRFLTGVFNKIFRVIPQEVGKKNSAYVEILIRFAQFKRETCTEEGQGMFAEARTVGWRFANAHVASAQFELELGNYEKAVKILERARDLRAEPVELLNVAHKNLIMKRKILLPEEERLRILNIPDKENMECNDNTECNTDTICDTNTVELLEPKKSWLAKSPAPQKTFTLFGSSQNKVYTDVLQTPRVDPPDIMSDDSNHGNTGNTAPCTVDDTDAKPNPPRTLRTFHSTPDCKYSSLLSSASKPFSNRKMPKRLPMRVVRSTLPELGESTDSGIVNTDMDFKPLSDMDISIDSGVQSRDNNRELSGVGVTEKRQNGVNEHQNGVIEKPPSGFKTRKHSETDTNRNHSGVSVKHQHHQTGVNQHQIGVSKDTDPLPVSYQKMAKLEVDLPTQAPKSAPGEQYSTYTNAPSGQNSSHGNAPRGQNLSYGNALGGKNPSHSNANDGQNPSYNNAHGRQNSSHSCSSSGQSSTLTPTASNTVKPSNAETPIMSEVKESTPMSVSAQPRASVVGPDNTPPVNTPSVNTHAPQVPQHHSGQSVHPQVVKQTPPQVPVAAAPTPVAATQPSIPGRDNLAINGQNYIVLRLIGRGGTSKVYEVLDAKYAIRAVKCINLELADETTIDSYRNEITLLQHLQTSKKVIKMYDFEFSDENCMLYVVMERGDHDLASYIRDHSRLGGMHPVKIKSSWYDMLQAVQVLHTQGIVHSDLKPANFISVKGTIKLIDFGIANKIQDDMTSVVREEAVGTINYMSPEAIMDTCAGTQVDEHGKIKQRIKIGVKSDVWSLGCILYFLVYNKTPFQHITNQLMKMKAITSSKFNIEFPEIEEKDLMDTLMRCLVREPKQRPSIEELLAHPYLKA